MSSILMKLPKLYLALLISIFFIGLVLNYFGALYDTSDDLGNNCNIEGDVFLKEPASNLHYVKALLPGCIRLIPDMSALGIAKYDVFHFLIYLIILIYLLKVFIWQGQKNFFAKVILTCLLCLVLIPLIIRPQYTNTAGLLALILVLFLRRSSTSQTFKSLIIGFILVFIGYGLRK
jgi:hypothetical protein